MGGFAERVSLVDHHVHGPFTGELDRAGMELALNEASPEPVPKWMTQFDSQVGFAVRRWCAPLLGLQAHVAADEYWSRRQELGVKEVTARFLRTAGVSDWVVDTEPEVARVLDPGGMAALSGAHSHRVVRLESVAEQLWAEGVSGRDYADRFGERLAEASRDAVGVKTILAYRCGFDLDLGRPDPTSVRIAANRWQDSGVARLTNPVLLRFGIHAAVDLGMPLQVHTGFGDRDLDLFRSNPLLLLDFLRLPWVAEVPVLLLHTYPYHREAGYLAQAFPNVYFDVGLGVNHLGARSVELISESFELAPFAKLLYSSDAWGLPELHYLGAVLWRRAIDRTFGRWVEDGDWAAADAHRVTEMVARRNALRVYGLD
jgi:predicted TIM-barrel fold metal-dependent hydrolase